jgi:pSer/pThr/pTyr-binding forkhead associated (FHA) protein
LALTLLIQHSEEVDPLSLSFDAPRIVLGRSRNCDVILPDPTVSSRHASLRHEGGRWLLVDEGSSNGLLLGNVRLSAHTPRVLDDGAMVRIGRSWLEVRLGSSVASPGGEAERVARAMLAAQLAAEGEPLVPDLYVVAGPDKGVSLALSDTSRAHLIGRASDCDLALRDELVSRRHAEVDYQGGSWWLRDFGSKRGTRLNGQEVSERCRLAVAASVEMGGTTLRLRDPLAEALDEALSCPDLKMAASEFDAAPPGQDEPLEVVSAPAEVEAEGSAEKAPMARVELPAVELEPAAAKWDLIVALVAVGLLGASIAGLWWLLG